MNQPKTPISRYTTLHVSVVPRPDGTFAVAAVERTWANGARDSSRVIHRGTVKAEARPGSTDSGLWMAGVYLQQLAARGVVTRLGTDATKERRREPLGAVGGDSGPETAARHADEVAD